MKNIILVLIFILGCVFAAYAFTGPGLSNGKILVIGGSGMGMYQKSGATGTTYWTTARTVYWTNTRVALWTTPRNTEIP